MHTHTQTHTHTNPKPTEKKKQNNNNNPTNNETSQNLHLKTHNVTIQLLLSTPQKTKELTNWFIWKRTRQKCSKWINLLRLLLTEVRQHQTCVCSLPRVLKLFVIITTRHASGHRGQQRSSPNPVRHLPRLWFILELYDSVFSSFMPSTAKMSLLT